MPPPAVVLLALVAAVAAVGRGAPPAADPKPVVGSDPEYECRFDDGSVVVVTLAESSLVTQTKFGKMTVPLAEVKKIEMGFRYPPGMEAKVRQAVEDLGSREFGTREAAQKTLVGCGEYAVPLVRAGTQSAVPEVAERCAAILKKVTATLPAEQSDPPMEDVITTEDMVIRGKIASESFRANTKLFGELTVKLTDLRELRPLGGRFVGTFTVDAVKHAAPGWKTFFDTGLEVEKGQPVEVTATGKIDQHLQAPGKHTTGPGGTGARVPGPGQGGYRRGFGDDDMPYTHTSGALYGRIGGSGKLFKIGERTTIPKAAESGRLYLVIAPSSFGGGSKGEYEVKVKLGK